MFLTPAYFPVIFVQMKILSAMLALVALAGSIGSAAGGV